MNKNILIIIASLGGGGAEKVATSIGTELNKQNNVYYLTWYENRDEYEYKGKKICFNERFSKSSFIKIFKLIKRAYNIKTLSKKLKIDTCISFMEESNFPSILSKILFGNKSKTIVSVRVSVDNMSIIYKKIIRILYPKSDLIVPNSYEEGKNLYKNYGINKNKIKVIYNPLNTEVLNSLKNTSVESGIFKKDIFTFITVGRIAKSKNQIFMINTFMEFYKVHKNSQFLILGDGPLKGDLKRFSSSCPAIKFLGKQNNVYKFLSNSDCFLFSSFTEGFPNAVIEAMGCGLPIISTKFKTGITELIENNKYGILVDGYNEKLYYNAMEQIYSNKHLRSTISKNVSRKINLFNLELIMNNWKQII